MTFKQKVKNKIEQKLTGSDKKDRSLFTPVDTGLLKIKYNKQKQLTDKEQKVLIRNGVVYYDKDDNVYRMTKKGKERVKTLKEETISEETQVDRVVSKVGSVDKALEKGYIRKCSKSGKLYIKDAGKKLLGEDYISERFNPDEPAPKTKVEAGYESFVSYLEKNGVKVSKKQVKKWFDKREKELKDLESSLKKNKKIRNPQAAYWGAVRKRMLNSFKS